MQPSPDRHTTDRLLTVPEAAVLLGVTPDAVRSRLRRGKLPKVVKDGTVYVRVTDASHGDQSNGHSTVESTVSYISALKSQIDLLADQVQMLKEDLEDRREEARRRDMVIAQMNQTISELARRLPAPEPPSELRESPEKPSEEPGKGKPPDEERRQPWWRRMFRG
jgi:hypothetical protein